MKAHDSMVPRIVGLAAISAAVFVVAGCATSDTNSQAPMPPPTMQKAAIDDVQPITASTELDKPAVMEIKSATSTKSKIKGPTYKVQKGDSLSTIAWMYGIKVSEIQELNSQVKDPKKLKAGITLDLPAHAKKIHARPVPKKKVVAPAPTPVTTPAPTVDPTTPAAAPTTPGLQPTTTPAPIAPTAPATEPLVPPTPAKVAPTTAEPMPGD